MVIKIFPEWLYLQFDASLLTNSLKFCFYGEISYDCSPLSICFVSKGMLLFQPLVPYNPASIFERDTNQLIIKYTYAFYPPIVLIIEDQYYVPVML